MTLPPEAPKPKKETKKQMKVEFKVEEILPVQNIVSYIDEDKNIETKLLLVPEALTEILNRLDRIEKGITG